MIDAVLTRARAAVFTVFGLNGFLLAMWVVHIPVVQQRVGIGHAALGTLLLALAVGAIAGMQATGYFADRFGSDRTTLVFGVMLAVAVIGPGSRLRRGSSPSRWSCSVSRTARSMSR